jgi:sarcosine oxidase subunit gamma
MPRAGALDHLELGRRPSTAGAPLRLTEVPHTAKVGLRGDGAVVTAAGTALGLDLPRSVGGTVSAGGRTAFWIGPDDWIVTGEPGSEAALVQRLDTSLAGLPHAVVDITERMTVIRLEGPPVRDVLSAGCPLDLHPRSFVPGMVLASHLAKASVLLHFASGDASSPVVDLYVNRSFADYVWLYLENAAREVGYEIRA